MRDKEVIIGMGPAGVSVGLCWKNKKKTQYKRRLGSLRASAQLLTYWRRKKSVKVIYFQLKHGFHKNQANSSGLGTSIFLDETWLSQDNFLYLLCKEFFSLMLEAPVVDGTLLSWTKKLKKLLETTLGWKFEDSAVTGIYRDDDEFAPVVEMLEE